MPVRNQFNWDAEFSTALRDYFAAKAMQGIAASGPSHAWTDERIARDAYGLADAMLAAREVKA